MCRGADEEYAAVGGVPVDAVLRRVWDYGDFLVEGEWSAGEEDWVRVGGNGDVTGSFRTTRRELILKRWDVTGQGPRLHDRLRGRCFLAVLPSRWDISSIGGTFGHEPSGNSSLRTRVLICHGSD